MRHSLWPCASCKRHVREGSAVCPFCLKALVPAVVAIGVMAALGPGPAEAQPQPPLRVVPAYGVAPPIERQQWMQRMPQDLTVNEVTLRQVPDAAAVTRALTAQYEPFARCAALPGRAPVEGAVSLSARGAVTRVRFRTGNRLDQRCVLEALRSVSFVAWPTGYTVGFTLRRRPRAVLPNAPVAPTPSRCGASPAGCRRDADCQGAMRCVRSDRCLPSTCSCDARTGDWTCTSDCGGGICMTAAQAGSLRRSEVTP